MHSERSSRLALIQQKLSAGLRAKDLSRFVVIITTADGKSFDTETDLTAPERHMLQKLFLWESLAVSLEQFREKRDQALLKGWNNSGPIRESPALKRIIRDLERKVSHRLKGRVR